MKTNTINIGFTKVPVVDYAIGAAAVLGIRDSGKTVTAKGIAEQLIDGGIPIIVFDAVGKWQWMKVAGDSPRGKAYKVVVAGGRNPDLPLTPGSVAEIVRAALKERIPLVIDLFDRNLSKADWRRIVQTAIRIIHYENDGGAVHVFLEEAAEFCPQRIEDGATYAEIEKLVRMGGNAAVGITLINQRSQEINKAVLDQCTTLVLGCQVGSRSIESVEKWMDRLDSLTAEAVAKKLPQLKAGQAFVWTRQNPEKPQLEQIAMCRSLHPDRRTPETVLKTAKTTDTAEFVAKLSKAIPQLLEQAKANDPEQLKKRIAELERQAKSISPTVKTVEVPLLTDDDRKSFEVSKLMIEHFADTADSLKQQVASLQNGIVELRHDYMSIVHKFLSANNDRPNKILPAQRRSERPVSAPSAPVARDPIAIGGGMRRMLVALAQRSPLSDRQLGVRAGLSSKSGTFGTYLATLRQNGFIDGQRDALTISQDGLQALGDYEPLPTGQALLDYWLNRLSGGQMRMLSCLAAKYPQSMTDADLGEAAGVASNSGTFGTYLAGLRTLELVSGKRSALLASAELFD